tara:strand:- start:21227 stop:21694 length:468 start_codon:yes stop_codon:yes gene_type:complete
MASTVKAATLTTTITEQLTLNGHTYGNTITCSIASQGEVVQRIMNIPATETSVLDLGSSTDGLGTVVGDSLAYFRITNLDDTNHVFINVGVDQSGSTDGQVTFKLGAKKSLLLMNNQIAIEADDAGAYVLEDIYLIKAKCSAETNVDIEFIAITA